MYTHNHQICLFIINNFMVVFATDDSIKMLYATKHAMRLTFKIKVQ